MSSLRELYSTSVVRSFGTVWLMAELCIVSESCTRESPQTGINRVWAVDDGEKVKQEDVHHWASTSSNNGVWDGTKVTIFGGRNEVVAFQLIIEGDATGATDVNVVFKALSSPVFTIANSSKSGGPYDYAGKHIELFLEHYLSVGVRSVFDGTVGWNAPGRDSDFLGDLPDPLIPFEAPAGRRLHGQGGAPFDVPPLRNQGVWVDVYIPREAPAGLYQGTLEILVKGTVTQTIPVSLQVYGFTLPDSSHFKNTMHIDAAGIRGKHGVSDTSRTFWTLLRRYITMGHRHRANITYSRSTVDQFAQNLAGYYTGASFTAAEGYDGPGLSVGNNVYSIGTYDQPRVAGESDYGYLSGFWPSTEQGWRVASDAWENWFATNAPLVYRFKYMADEPDPNVYPDIIKKASWIHNNPGRGSKLHVLCTTGGIVPALIGSIDDWITTGQAGYVARNTDYQLGYVVASAVRRRAAGELVGFYNGTYPSYGVQLIDVPAVHLRANSWIAWKYKVDMYCLWYTDDWGEDNGPVMDPWAANWNGRAWGFSNLFYPGENKDSDPDDDRGLQGPIASIRLKNWRRGEQDYEYLWLARCTGLETATLVDEVVPAALSDAPQSGEALWSERGFRYDNIRRRIADMLDRKMGD